MVNLQKRKEEVLHNVEEQGLLTTDLKSDILKQTKLQRVEDLYRPFKQKKKTRATEAKRKGLEPFAKWLKQSNLDTTIENKAQQFLNEEIETIEAAIKGAQDIIAELVSDAPKYRTKILKDTFQHGNIITQKKKNAEDEKEIFSMYYDYSEPVKKIANHRIYRRKTWRKRKNIISKIRNGYTRH